MQTAKTSLEATGVASRTPCSAWRCPCPVRAGRICSVSHLRRLVTPCACTMPVTRIRTAARRAAANVGRVKDPIAACVCRSTGVCRIVTARTTRFAPADLTAPATRTSAPLVIVAPTATAPPASRAIPLIAARLRIPVIPIRTARALRTASLFVSTMPRSGRGLVALFLPFRPAEGFGRGAIRARAWWPRPRPCGERRGRGRPRRCLVRARPAGRG